MNRSCEWVLWPSFAGVSDLLPIFASTLHDVAPVLAATTIVIAVGQSAYEECRKRNVLCFYDEEAAMRNKELELLNNNMPRNKTPKFLQIGWDKLQRLQVSGIHKESAQAVHKLMQELAHRLQTQVPSQFKSLEQADNPSFGLDSITIASRLVEFAAPSSILE